MSAETKTYTQMRNDFYQKFQKKCLPILLGFESERSLALKIIIGVIVLTVSLIGILWLYFLQKGTMVPDFFYGISVGLFLLYMAGINFYAKVFERKIKRQIMPIVCQCFPDLKWVEESDVNHSLYLSSGLLEKRPDKSEVDDVFHGSYKEVPFEVVEVEYVDIRRERGSDGRYKEHRYTIFDGVFITLGMNKNFVSHTLVKPDSLIKMQPVSGLKHTTLEDVVFEKKFDVFTNDEVDARYLLTTSFMERLTDVKNSYKSSDVSCAFYNNQLIIALDVRRDMFKVGSLLTKTNDTKQYFQMYGEIVSIIKLIDHFKLDQKIGL